MSEIKHQIINVKRIQGITSSVYTGYYDIFLLTLYRVFQGYTRAIQKGGPLVNCVPCNCNGRSTDCDPQTGICRNCRTGTTGDHCERCMPNLMQPNCTSCMPGFWKISASGCQCKYEVSLL